MTATTAITATAVPMHSKLSDQMFNNHPLEKSQDTKIHHKNLFTFENFLYPYIRLPDSVYYNGHLDFQEKKIFCIFKRKFNKTGGDRHAPGIDIVYCANTKMDAK